MGFIDKSSSFPDLMANVATSLTMLYQLNSNLTISGSEGRLQSPVEINWIWLILPMAVIVLGNAFLVFVIMESKRTKTQIWKSSSLAMVYNGYTQESSASVDMEKISVIEKHSEGLKVSFKRSEETGLLGWEREWIWPWSLEKEAVDATLSFDVRRGLFYLEFVSSSICARIWFPDAGRLMTWNLRKSRKIE